jgi:hypothetical protein
MTLRNSLVLALLAGIGGVLVGRAIPRDAPGAGTIETPPHAPLTAAPRHGCNAERAELASTKTQLAICMAFRAPPSEADTPDAPEQTEEWSDAARVRRNREVWAAHKEFVFVRHPDGSVHYYPPNEPIHEGLIVARRLPNGEIGWYTGPGPRTDPAAFQPSPDLVMPVIRREADGTITVNGKPGDPVLQRFGGKPPD